MVHNYLLTDPLFESLGPLEIDQEICAALRATGHFDALDIEADEVWSW